MQPDERSFMDATLPTSKFHSNEIDIDVHQRPVNGTYEVTTASK
jgi:hypothetical protein